MAAAVVLVSVQSAACLRRAEMESRVKKHVEANIAYFCFNKHCWGSGEDRKQSWLRSGTCSVSTNIVGEWNLSCLPVVRGL